MNLRNGRIGIIDLATGQATEEEHETEGMAVDVARALIARHGSDSVVLASGVLTGSLVPAACSSAIVTEDKAMVLLGFAGVEQKLSGFDFLVLKGSAPQPGYVWARDGIVEFVKMADAAQLNSWQRTDRIRADQGDSKIQAVSGGPWCDSGSSASQLVTDFWGGEDKCGMGAELGKRNLAAVAFRGMGELELADPEAHFEASVALVREHLERLGPNKGLASYYDGASRADFAGLVHRHIACFGCPFPCRTYLKTEEDPKEMLLLSKEPGYLHYDIAGLAKASDLGMVARDASRALASCARAGAEPVAVLVAASAKGTPDLAAVTETLSGPRTVKPSGALNFESSFSARGDYDRCIGLGLCPRYWAKVGLDLDAISKCAEPALGSRLP